MSVQRTDSASQTLTGTDLVKLLAKTVKGSLPRIQVSFARQGRAVFRLRSIRSWRASCCGQPGSMRSGKAPRSGPLVRMATLQFQYLSTTTSSARWLCVGRARLWLAKNPVIPRSHTGECTCSPFYGRCESALAQMANVSLPDCNLAVMMKASRSFMAQVSFQGIGVASRVPMHSYLLPMCPVGTGATRD